MAHNRLAILGTLFSLLAAGPVAAQVMYSPSETSGLVDFEKTLAADGAPEANATLQDDFALLQAHAFVPKDADLLVKKTGVLAEAIDAQTIMVGDQLAALSRPQRLFVLAHEGSHALHGDKENTRLFLDRNLPRYASSGENRERLGELSPAMQDESHRREYRADRDGYRAVRDLKAGGLQDIHQFFLAHQHGTTRSHPGTLLRMKALAKIAGRRSP